MSLNGIMSSETINQIGSWTDCINPLNKINHGFFRRKGFLNDNQKICSMCWSECLKLEGYHHAGFIINTHKKSNDCKPEKDSL